MAKGKSRSLSPTPSRTPPPAVDSLREAFERYTVERVRYERLARMTSDRLRAALGSARIPCRIDHRAKDMASLIKKCMKKGKTYDEVGDRAGARVVLLYPDHHGRAIDTIERSLVNHQREVKNTAPEVLGYSALHWAYMPARGELNDEFDGCTAEVQLHRPGESMWATFAHDTLYKSDNEYPPEIQRRVLRLKAVCDILDDEMRQSRDEMAKAQPAAIRELLPVLEREYLSITAQAFDRELSESVLLALLHGKTNAEIDKLASDVTSFVADNRATLNAVLDRGDGDYMSVAMRQPEVILLCMLIQADPIALDDVWPEVLPRSFCLQLMQLLGVDISA